MNRLGWLMMAASILLAACDFNAPSSPTGINVGSDVVYPLPTLTPFPKGPKFALKRPLYVGDAVVRGTGPVNVPIRISDANLIVGSAAMVLGTGVIGANGDLSGTNFKPENFLSGEGYSDRPFVGVVFDIVAVAALPVATKPP